MPDNLPKLKIVSDGISPKNVKVLTEDGTDITKYIKSIDISIRGGTPNKVILTVFSDFELECE